MFTALIGDLFASKAQTLVNTVNCVGVMGKGVALEFKRRIPGLFDDYAARCAAKRVHLGEPYLYEDVTGGKVVNFPTKDHWRSPSRLSDIERGLDHFVSQYQVWGITSIAFPPLGCGNGGLLWSDVGPLMYRKLHHLPITIEVYAPYGTPRNELTGDFLGGGIQLSIDDRGRRADKMPDEWVVIVEALRQLGQQPYANPVGRVIFQKLCYVLTEMGLETGFTFGQGSYGPFADEVKRALHEFANRNWVQERSLGRMIALKVDPQFERDSPRYAQVIERNARRIAKVVDLFSRIKSTDQAEEMMTILFASRELKRERPDQPLTEQDLHSYIVEWKKGWATTDKQASLANSIRHLVLLGWMKLEISDMLCETA